MKISARNILKGNVKSVEKGPITSTVKLKIESPSLITAIISKESVEELDVKVGDEVMAVIKSTEVMIAKE
jgi:molybdopterin-binding protein